MQTNNLHNKLSYIKPLDGIRGLAILLVVFFHSPVPIFQFEFGWVGVNLFFVLSGFLITRILLNINFLDLKTYIKTFYMRRVLRIFPLYYFYLIVIFFFLLFQDGFFKGTNYDITQGISDFQRNFLFMISYTYNFGTIVNFWNHKDYVNSAFTGHLWTLSVEEQFYLIFPIIVYFISIKNLKRLAVALILLIPLLRLFTITVLLSPIHDFYWKGIFLYNSTIFQLDAFAMGACLMLFNFDRLTKNLPLYLLSVLFLTAIVGAVHLFYLGNFQMAVSSLGFDTPIYHLSKKPSPYEILNQRYFYTIPLLNILSAFLILISTSNKLAWTFFSNRLLVSIGKISYGIYIYHLAGANLFAIFITTVFHKQIAQLSWVGQATLMCIYLVLLFCIAQLSYVYFESIFLNLKKKYSYNNQENKLTIYNSLS